MYAELKPENVIKELKLENDKELQAYCPELKYSKVIIGSVFQYLDSLNDVEKSLSNIYNSLTNDGRVLAYHHYDKNNYSNKEWDLLLINFEELEDISKRIGFKLIKRVKVGLYYGDPCGRCELSVLLIK